MSKYKQPQRPQPQAAAKAAPVPLRAAPEQKKPMATVAKDNWLLLLLGVLAVTAICMYPSIPNEFVNWDDDRYITDNTLLQPLSFETIKAIFSQDVSANYNPWAIVSLAIDKQFFGLNPVPYHIHNLVLHLLCTALVFWWMRLLKLGNTAAAVVALLFGMHTMRVESVAWVTERKDVLFGAYYVAAAIAYMKYVYETKNKYLYYAIALAMMVMACASKIQAVAFPLGMLAVDLYLNRDENWSLPKLIRLGVEKIPFFAVSIATGLIGIHFLSSTMDSGQLYPFWQRLFFAPYALFIYIWKFFTPILLSACHPYPASAGGLLPWYIFASAIPITALIAFLFLRFRNNRAVVFGMLFFFFNIVFLLQIVGAGQGFLAERFTYIAYIGFFFLVGYALQYAEDTAATWKTNYTYGLGLWVLVLGVLTFVRCGVWHNSNTLWSDVLEKYEFVDVAYNNRGTFYREAAEKSAARGQADSAKMLYQIALDNYSKVLERKPDDTNVFLNRGNVYFAQNVNDKAAVDYDKVIELCKVKKTIEKDSESKAWGNRGAIFFRVGNLDKAVEYITKALEIYPKYPDAHMNRGCSYSVRGNAYLSQGNKEAAAADHAAAKKDYEAYIATKKDNPSVYNWLAIEKNYVGDYQGAIQDLNKAIEINPSANKGEYYFNRALSYQGLGDTDKKRADAQKAVSMGWAQAAQLAQ